MIDRWTFEYLRLRSIMDVINIASNPEQFRDRSVKWLNTDEQDRVVSACKLIQAVLENES